MKISGSVTYRWSKDDAPPSQFVELREAHHRGRVVQWRPDEHDGVIRITPAATVPMRVTAVTEGADADLGFQAATVQLESVADVAGFKKAAGLPYIR